MTCFSGEHIMRIVSDLPGFNDSAIDKHEPLDRVDHLTVGVIEKAL